MAKVYYCYGIEDPNDEYNMPEGNYVSEGDHNRLRQRVLDLADAHDEAGFHLLAGGLRALLEE